MKNKPSLAKVWLESNSEPVDLPQNLPAKWLTADALTFKTEPWPHQRDALLFLLHHEKAALFTKPGSGKTKIIIDLIVNKGFQRTLVCAPKKAAESVWKNEILLHSQLTDRNIADIAGQTLKAKLAILQQLKDFKEPLIIIVNYDVMYNPELLAVLEKFNLDCIVCDESHRIKSPGGKTSKALFKLGKKVKYRYIVSGTPFSDKPTDIFAQFRFMNVDIFGTSYQRFFAEYTNLDTVLSSRIGHPILDKKEPYKNQEKLAALVEKNAYMMQPVLELQPIKEHFIYFSLGVKFEADYKTLQKDGFLPIANSNFAISAENVLAKKSLEQRFLTGFVPAKNPLGELKIFKLHNKRKQALAKLLERFQPWERIVIFYKFAKDKEIIFDVCKNAGRTCGEISGKQNDLKLWKDEELQTIAVQFAAGAEGINLTESSICIFYNLPYSLALYEQSKARQHRPGQLATVHYYYLLTEGNNVDNEILDCLQKKRNYIDEVEKGRY